MVEQNPQHPPLALYTAHTHAYPHGEGDTDTHMGRKQYFKKKKEKRCPSTTMIDSEGERRPIYPVES